MRACDQQKLTYGNRGGCSLCGGRGFGGDGLGDGNLSGLDLLNGGSRGSGLSGSRHYDKNVEE